MGGEKGKGGNAICLETWHEASRHSSPGSRLRSREMRRMRQKTNRRASHLDKEHARGARRTHGFEWKKIVGEKQKAGVTN